MYGLGAGTATLDGAPTPHEPAFSIVNALHTADTYACPVKEVGDATTQPLVEYVPATSANSIVSFIVKGVPVKLTEAYAETPPPMQL